jgi:hypothetical protein
MPRAAPLAIDFAPSGLEYILLTVILSLLITQPVCHKAGSQLGVRRTTHIISLVALKGRHHQHRVKPCEPKIKIDDTSPEGAE